MQSVYFFFDTSLDYCNFILNHLQTQLTLYFAA